MCHYTCLYILHLSSDVYTDVKNFWIWGEFIVNSIFTIEIILRMSVSESIYLYLYDVVNLVDWIAILPFYIDLVRWGGEGRLDFSILASSPRPLFFVAVRSFKVRKVVYGAWCRVYSVWYMVYGIWCITASLIVLICVLILLSTHRFYGYSS
ncbi:hypothetical protein EON63_16675 [archaeon]|nr:MAG: hypothetical protein EON63_16675 [archaeon]